MTSTFDGSRLSTGEHTHTEGSSPPATSQVATDNLPISWETVVDALRRHTASGARADQLAVLLAELMPALVHSPAYTEYFRMWESSGIHVTPVHFYSPIPNTAELPASIWTNESPLSGIDMNDRGQLKLLAACQRYQDEYNALPQDATGAPERFFLRNPMFGGTDALVLYAMVRHFKPRSIIEVGSGFSTRLFVEAASLNGPTDILCIEPYPEPVLRQRRLPVELIERRVQDVALATFERLEAGDFLFIDSSHVLRIGGDVSYLLLEVLPILKPGVIVQVHDIFLPRQPPREWVVDQLRFWSEQDLLQAFLAFNRAFEVLLSNAYLALRHEAVLREAFPRADWWGGGSFWIRRTTKEDR